VGLKVDEERDDEDIKGFKSGLESSQCVSVVDLHIMREHPNYWEL
jgi:hypothetical protein